MECDEERRREVVISGGGACEYCSCGTTHLREKESRIVKKMGNSRSEKDSVEGGSAKDEGTASGRENRSARGKVNSSMRLLEHKKYGIIFMGISLKMFLPVLDGKNGLITHSGSRGPKLFPQNTSRVLETYYI